MVTKKRRRGEARDDSKAEVIEDLSMTAKRPRTRAAARIEDESGSPNALQNTKPKVQSDGTGRDMAALKRKISRLEGQLRAQGAKAQAKADEFETLKRTFTFDLSTIEERLICGICINTLWYPYLLQDCGHSFCEDCILSWLSESQRNLTCPHCRMAIRDMPTEIIFVMDLVQSVSHTQAKLGVDVELRPERAPQARKKIEEMFPDGRPYWKRKSEEQRHILETRSRAFVTPPFADQIRALPPPAAVQGGGGTALQLTEVRQRELMEMLANNALNRIGRPQEQGNPAEQERQRQATNTRLQHLAEAIDRNAERIERVESPAQRENFLEWVERGRRYHSRIMHEMNDVPAERRMVGEQDITLAEQNQRMLATQLDRVLQPRDLGAEAILEPTQPVRGLAEIFGLTPDPPQHPAANQMAELPIFRRYATSRLPVPSINDQMQNLRERRLADHGRSSIERLA